MTAARRGAAVVALAMLGAAPDAADAQADRPFRTRNLSPPVSIFGIPVWRSGAEGRRATLTTELANHFRGSQQGADVLILDGETTRVALHLETGLGERWFAAAELPYFHQSGGVLDGVVDGWHSLFGLPDGGRDNAPEGRLRYRMHAAGGEFYALDASDGGFGDAQLAVGRRLGRDGTYSLTATVKLPTGDERLLAGSGSTDVALTLLKRASTELGGKPAGGYWGVGAVATGTPDRIDFRRRRVVPMAVVGGGWQPLPRIGFRAQLDVSAAFYRTPLDELSQTSVQATLGGWWNIGARSRFEFAVNEDLHVSTSPDVVVHIGIEWVWP